MLQLHDTSPCVSAMFGFPDPQGVDTLVVVIKATFELAPTPVLAAKQRPIVLADEHHGDPATSSLRHPSEAHLAKPGTDVIVLGHAHAPRGRAVTELDLAVQVGDRLVQGRVHGDRSWTQGGRDVVPSEPLPFVRMPVIYERAYGGAFGSEVEPRNPVGLGFLGARHPTELLGQPVPNLDDPRAPLTRLGQSPTPFGFAAIAPTWQPRVALAGTYDAAWAKTRAPYLPLDFDVRYFQVASPGLVFESPLRGGEPVLLDGFHPEGRLRFSLPRCRFEVSAKLAGEAQRLNPRLETVVLEPDELRFTMTWRACSRVGPRMLRVERVEVGLAELEGVGR